MWSAFKVRLHIIERILEIFDHRERLQLLALFGLMVVGAAVEVVGIGIVTSFVAVIADPQLLSRHEWAQWLDKRLGQRSVAESVALFSAVLFVVFLIKNAYLGMLVYAQSRFAYGKEAKLSTDLLSSYLSEPYPFFLQRNSAELAKNVIQEVGHVVTGIVLPALILMTELVVLLFILALLAAVEPTIALLVFGVLGLTSFLFTQAVKPVLYRIGWERSASSTARIQWVNQAIGSIKEVKLLGRENFFIDAFNTGSQRYARAGLVSNTIHSIPRLLIETVAVASILIVAIVIHHQGRDFQTMLPTLTLFALAAMRVMPSVNRMTPAVNQIRFWLPALQIVHRDLCEARSERFGRQVAGSLHAPGTGRTVLTSELRVDSVWFRYPGADRWALRDVSLRISKGASVAFMGSSGAGKSTIVDLILGLMAPDKGTISIDGTPLQDVVREWQHRIGYVPQSIYLIDDSIRHNVALGIPDPLIEDARVWHALHQARLGTFVEQSARQLNTMVGERGVRLSGGERQRVGIARALYHRPEVLVLDEATSAVDGQTERDIADTIRALSGATTVIVVAHRLSTVMSCDKIFFLQRGEVQDRGPFAKLAAENPAFREMIGHISQEPDEAAT